MTTPLSPEYLAEIAARAEAATAGPWCTDGAELYQGDEYAWDAFWVGETCRADEADGGTADAAFIAAARTDVPALLAEVERLRKSVTYHQDRADRLSRQVSSVRRERRVAEVAARRLRLAWQSARMRAAGERQAAEWVRDERDEELERLRAELADRPTRAEAPRTERSRWQAVADALNDLDIAGIDLDGTIAGHNAWSVVWDRDAGWMVSGPATEAGESR